MKPRFTELKDLIRNPRPKHFLPEKQTPYQTHAQEAFWEQMKETGITELTPIEVIDEWLDSIGSCEEEKAEVHEQCQNDVVATEYYFYMAIGKR